MKVWAGYPRDSSPPRRRRGRPRHPSASRLSRPRAPLSRPPGLRPIVGGAAVAADDGVTDDLATVFEETADLSLATAFFDFEKAPLSRIDNIRGESASFRSQGGGVVLVLRDAGGVPRRYAVGENILPTSRTREFFAPVSSPRRERESAIGRRIRHVAGGWKTTHGSDKLK